MKIKYIKENFFDDDPNIDNLTPEQVVVQDHIDHLMSKVIPEYVTDLMIDAYNKNPGMIHRVEGLIFPIPMNRFCSRNDSHSYIINSYSLSLNPDLFKQSTSRIAVSSSFDNKSKTASVTLNWIYPKPPHTSSRDLHRQFSEIPAICNIHPHIWLKTYNYSYLVFEQTYNYLRSLHHRIYRDLVNEFNLPLAIFTDLSLVISINSVPLLSLTRDYDYYDYIKAVTSYSITDFERVSNQVREYDKNCLDNPVKYAAINDIPKYEHESLVPPTSYIPPSDIKYDTDFGIDVNPNTDQR